MILEGAFRDVIYDSVSFKEDKAKFVIATFFYTVNIS